MANPRRRRGQRARPMWLEIGGQQRLRRLHAGLQTRRRQFQDWSERVGEMDDRIVGQLRSEGEGPQRDRGNRPDRGNLRGRGVRRSASLRRDDADDYGTGNEDVGSAPRGTATRRNSDRDTSTARRESSGRSGPSPRPPRRLESSYDGGYDIGAADVTGTRWLLRDRADRERADRGDDDAGSGAARRSGAARAAATPPKATSPTSSRSGTARKSTAGTAKKSTAKKSTAKKSTGSRSTGSTAGRRTGSSSSSRRRSR